MIHAPSVQDSIAAASPIVQTYILAAANATQNAYPQNVIVTQTQQLLGTGCAQQPFSGVGAIRASFISSEDIAAIASAVWANTTGTAMTIKLAEIWGRLGLDASKPLVTGNTSITFGEIAMAMSESAGSVTVTRK
ncbi:hypothetical protein [Propionivibrio sp.]|uniref:hypothetical protein n=1 Tax=Propionivibrio sp. TaxID=2212460 RepID=UPI003BF0D4E4